MEPNGPAPGHLPRPYGGDYPKQGFAGYEPADGRPDPLRTLDVERIGRYPLLAAWAMLRDVRLAGRAGVEILDQAIGDKTVQVNGPIMNEVAYYVGDLLCDETVDGGGMWTRGGFRFSLSIRGASPAT